MQTACFMYCSTPFWLQAVIAGKTAPLINTEYAFTYRPSILQ